MTKKQAVEIFKVDHLRSVKGEYEKDGIPDYPARCEAWSYFIDYLCKAGQITQKQYDKWTYPYFCEAPWER